MYVTRSQHKKIMESNPSSSNVTTPMGATESMFGMPSHLFDPREYQTLQPQQQPQCPPIIIEDITNRSMESEEFIEDFF